MLVWSGLVCQVEEELRQMYLEGVRSKSLPRVTSQVTSANILPATLQPHTPPDTISFRR